MISRFKLIVLLLIVALLSLVFIQNRELLGLKLLCPAPNQSCLYQTPQLPLALWMGVFTFSGVIISLLGQGLNRYRYSSVPRTRNQEQDLGTSTRSRSARNKITEDYGNSSTSIQDSPEPYNTTSYERLQEPESVERSGSTYSFKYREAKDKSNNGDASGNSYDQPRDTFPSANNQTNREDRSSINLDKDDDEDWI